MVVKSVSEYVFFKEDGYFSFTKDGMRNFVPRENVVYFGGNFIHLPI